MSQGTRQPKVKMNPRLQASRFVERIAITTDVTAKFRAEEVAAIQLRKIRGQIGPLKYLVWWEQRSHRECIDVDGHQ
jgi:hypothetical protein